MGTIFHGLVFLIRVLLDLAIALLCHAVRHIISLHATTVDALTSVYYIIPGILPIQFIQYDTVQFDKTQFNQIHIILIHFNTILINSSGQSDTPPIQSSIRWPLLPGSLRYTLSLQHRNLLFRTHSSPLPRAPSLPPTDAIHRVVYRHFYTQEPRQQHHTIRPRRYAVQTRSAH